MVPLLVRLFRPMYTTKILKVDLKSVHFKDSVPSFTDEVTETNIQLAANEIKSNNNVVAFPTETVYGLGGSAINDESVKAIYKAKNRPADNPLIVHVSSVDQIGRKVFNNDQYQIPPIYLPLIEKFWPGPLTILLPIPEDMTCPVSKLVTAGQKTVGIRLPQHPIARALIAVSDTPIAAPSANASTRPSPTLALHVYHDLRGRIPYILDGGACDVGLESTVVDGLTTPPMLLRPGGVSLEQIKAVGGTAWSNIKVSKASATANEAVKTPGMKYRHYSPTAKVILFLNCKDGIAAVRTYMEQNLVPLSARIALLRSRYFAPADQISPQICLDRHLGVSGNHISHNLFHSLRHVDEANVDLIFVEGIDELDEGLAIMNRLNKAALTTVDGQ